MTAGYTKSKNVGQPQLKTIKTLKSFRYTKSKNVGQPQQCVSSEFRNTSYTKSKNVGQPQRSAMPSLNRLCYTKSKNVGQPQQYRGSGSNTPKLYQIKKRRPTATCIATCIRLRLLYQIKKRRPTATCLPHAHNCLGYTKSKNVGQPQLDALGYLEPPSYTKSKNVGQPQLGVVLYCLEEVIPNQKT